MSKFLTETDVAILRGQFREGRQLFRLINPVAYESDLLKAVVVVPTGYITDFASVPKMLFTYLIAGGTAYEAAVIHDWLYTVHAINGKPVSRALADQVLKEAIAASEDTNAPAWLMWAGVRLGGGSAWGNDGPAQPQFVSSVVTSEQGYGAGG